MATNFLEATGTNGFLATQSAFGTTQLSALASGTGVATGTQVFTAGTGGTLLGGQKAHAYLTVVTAGWTPAVGGEIVCWFDLSTDNGTTFESLVSSPSTTVMAMARPPDFVIPLYQGGAALAAGNIFFAAGPFRLPYLAYKVVAQNLCGVVLGTGNHTITIGSVADQY